MLGNYRERRKRPRLSSKNSEAASFKGPKSGALPAGALVADVSEMGVRLLFDWPEGRSFPLQVGDGMGFQLKIEGSAETFDLLSIVRRVEPGGRDGRVGVGVEFTGLEPELREAFQKALLSLAVTKLRAWRPQPWPAPQHDAAAGAAAEAGGRREGEAPERAAAEPPTDAPAGAAPATAGRRKLFLGEILVRQGALDADRLRHFLSVEFTGHRMLGEELQERGLTTEVAIARALAEQARLPYADPAGTSPSQPLAARFPRQVFQNHDCVPLREEGRSIVLAMASPPELQEVDEIGRALERPVRICIAPESALAAWRAELFNERPAQASVGAVRFRAQLRAEYRFMDREHTYAVDREANYGLTREISGRGLVLAGPLPPGITPERIAGEGLILSVQLDCPGIEQPMRLRCSPVEVQGAGAGNEFLLTCRIDAFPEGNEPEWARVCLVHGTHRFHRPAAGR